MKKTLIALSLVASIFAGSAMAEVTVRQAAAAVTYKANHQTPAPAPAPAAGPSLTVVKATYNSTDTKISSLALLYYACYSNNTTNDLEWFPATANNPVTASNTQAVNGYTVASTCTSASAVNGTALPTSVTGDNGTVVQLVISPATA